MKYKFGKTQLSGVKRDGDLFGCAECKRDIPPDENKTWVTVNGGQGVFYCDICCDMKRNELDEETSTTSKSVKASSASATSGSTQGTLNIADLKTLLNACLSEIIAPELEALHTGLKKINARIETLEQRVKTLPLQVAPSAEQLAARQRIEQFERERASKNKPTFEDEILKDARTPMH